MKRDFGPSWWLWLLTGCALGACLAGWQPGLAVAVALTAVQVAHQGLRTRRLGSLPVQVRVVYLVLLLIAAWPPLRALLFLLFAGLLVRVVFDYCALARLLSLMPWNRKRPLTLALVRATFLSRPVRGSILDQPAIQGGPR